MIMTTVILSIALTSVFAFEFENNNADSLQTNIPLAAVADSGDHHNITMEAVAMPDGMYAYRMASYNIDGGEELVNVRYSDKPSIPGPTIIMTEGDSATITLINSACENNFVDGPNHPLGVPTFSETSMIGMHVHGVHYDIGDDATYQRMNMNDAEDLEGAICGEDVTYEWVAAPGTAGAWPYHDHTFSINEVGAEELGLIGTVIINPADGKINGLVNEEGKIDDVDVEDIEKDFVLWMVSSETLGRNIFYGNEIDYDTTDYDGNENSIRETALWTNPNLFAVDGKIYRFHVIGLGDEIHAFHLHGHRWTEDIHEKSKAEDVIDVKEIVPLQRHSFIVKASDNDAADTTHGSSEGWMYHCHVGDHMKQGMSGMMTVLPNEGNFSDDLPEIGATFTLSDEPGLWMKTLDAGALDYLDEILDSLPLIDVETHKGTGYPISYLGNALAAIGGDTNFANSEARSFAVISPGQTVNFGMKDSQTKHTITTLVYPTGATLLGGNGILNAVPGLSHFDTQLGIRGSTLLVDKTGAPAGLDDPGLYVFVCKIHPYMFSAVIVDDPNTNLYINNPAITEGGDPIPFPLLDLTESGELTALVRTGNAGGFGDAGTTFPTSVPANHDLVKSLLTTFYVITDPNNWRDYNESNWTVNLPPALVTTNNEEDVFALAFDTTTTLNAATALQLTNSTGNGPAAEDVEGLQLDLVIPNPTVIPPDVSGIGDVWVNTQFERTLNKNHDGTPSDKPGTISIVETNTWTIERKIALPEINMNHPHNMWTDSEQEVVYQTQWFGNEMAVIDVESGELITEVFTGQSPSHVMTSPTTDKIYVAVNGEETVNEFDPETLEMTRQLSTGFRSHPHGHWISSDGQYIVTPDFIGLKASILNLNSNDAYGSDKVLFGPIATGMKSDEPIFYTADFLGNSMTAIDASNGEVEGHIDFLAAGAALDEPKLLGLPIQTPISPDNKWMVTALTLGSSIAVIDVTSTPGTIEKILPCDPGCHGVQWGAKSDDGYYAYVTSKFSNVMTVVDPEGDDGPEIAGRVLLEDRDADSDDRIIGYDGFGGQGVLAIPNVYDGWVDNLPSYWKSQLTPAQQNP
ncbi:MAG: multicopper oxidase domain-containing protein [Nitrosopumilus sp.]|nr:multicopper oxidase domain-containing protein [Nitrosopumilus sp.]